MLPRGFKSAASKLSLVVRRELGLYPTAPLDPTKLAEHLGITLMMLSSLRPELPEPVHHFAFADPGAFSAVTIFCGERRLVIVNDAHSRGRQASDIVHELSHVLLHHQPLPALDEGGCRMWSDDMEDEASWLTGVLLVPDAAAVDIVRREMSEDVAALTYGVSKKMVRYRLNVTGARMRVARERSRMSAPGPV